MPRAGKNLDLAAPNGNRYVSYALVEAPEDRAAAKALRGQNGHRGKGIVKAKSGSPRIDRLVHGVLSQPAKVAIIHDPSEEPEFEILNAKLHLGHKQSGVAGLPNGTLVRIESKDPVRCDRLPKAIKNMPVKWYSECQTTRKSNSQSACSVGTAPKQPKTTSGQLYSVDRVMKELNKILKPAGVERWLDTPNAAFENQTPRRLLDTGKIERIAEAIFAIRSGMPF